MSCRVQGRTNRKIPEQVRIRGRNQEKVKEIKKTEAELYTQISQELESGTIDKGLWTQAEGESGGGDEKKVKSIYGQVKLFASKYLINLFKTKKFPSTVLRLYLAYGPKQDINRFSIILT